MTADGQVGIYTNTIPGGTFENGGTVGINARDVGALVKAVGVGTTGFSQGSAVDLSNAGDPTSRYMVPPIIRTNEERASLKGGGSSATITGTVVANSNVIQILGGDKDNVTVGTVITCDIITNTSGNNVTAPTASVIRVSSISGNNYTLKDLNGNDATFGGTGTAGFAFNTTGSNYRIPIGSMIFDDTVDKLRYFQGTISDNNNGWANV